MVRPASRRRLSTCDRCVKCSSQVWLNTAISSRYATANPSDLLSSLFTKRWNVAGAFFMPKGMTLNSYSPKGVMKADFSCASTVMGICQYPLLKSMMVIY
ncbi:hypothetical protein GDO81_019868 [Engystomops pustulosus]|uniref:Uncharacterized protein n=1 Tax=Engystomops pustulosus TaxID=76066 RepID=A0AAV6YYA4_ENGPU|nr:hypothetical protein GDO81_019868 [Engystomops pustulosus]